MIKIYNTETKKKETFVPIEEGKVRMYVCGPTVYNFIHIGNARPMIVFDTVRRYFEYKGYDVNFVSNFTDVDDKIIKKAIEEGVSADEISQRYIAECKKDMAGMNIKPATTHPLATQEIDGMIDMISDLIDKGFAYPVNGTVYFRTRKFDSYGKLSHKNLDDLRAGNRTLLVSGEDEKEEEKEEGGDENSDKQEEDKEEKEDENEGQPEGEDADSDKGNIPEVDPKLKERAEIKFKIWRTGGERADWLNDEDGYQKIEYVYNDKKKNITIDFFPDCFEYSNKA